MSDISGSESSININAVVTDNATSATAIINNQLNVLAQNIASLAQRAQSASHLTSSLNKALGLTASGSSKASNEIGKTSRNLQILQQSMKNAGVEAAFLQKNMSAITSANIGGGGGNFNQHLAQYSSHLNAAGASHLQFAKVIKGNDLLNYGRQLKAAGMAAQQSGYYFSRNFSAPIIFGLREVFYNYAKLETQNIRVTKLLSDNFLGTGEEKIKLAKIAVAELGVELDKITKKWGVSRLLVQSLAGDYAELGVSSKEMLYSLVLITAEMEKLGNLDITSSQEFVSSMYQNILKLRRDTGMSVNMGNEATARAIAATLRGQMALFNLVENKTVMSLRNISEAFPEVSAAANLFGLSMTEAIALVTPMVAAGFQLGASANSVKVSLQRMNTLTKQNGQMIQDLQKNLQGFNYEAGVGISNIQALVDGFETLKVNKGQQGVLEFYSRLFGVRQGPRMATTFSQLDAFQAALRNQQRARAPGVEKTQERIIADQLEQSINMQLKLKGFNTIAVNTIEDLSMINKMASATVKGTDQQTQQARAVQIGQLEAQQKLKEMALSSNKNADFLGDTQTEVAKIFLGSAFDVNEMASQMMKLELDLAQKSPEVRYRQLKEGLLQIGRAIVPIVDDIIKFFVPIVQAFANFVQNLPTGVKKILGALLVILALAGPFKIFAGTLKQLIGMFSSARGMRLLGFGKIKKEILDIKDLISNPDILKYKKVVQIPDSQAFYTEGKTPGFMARRSLRNAIPDTSGLSPETLEILKKAGAVPGGPSASRVLEPGENIVNKFFKKFRNIMPDTAKFTKDLQDGIQTNSGKESKVADAIKKVDKSIKDSANVAEKTAKNAASKISKTVGHIFKGPNEFIGNTFIGNAEGNQFGPGKGRPGSGPSAPFVNPAGGGGGGSPGGQKFGIRYNNKVATPDTRPFYGPQFLPDTRPFYGPQFPPPFDLYKFKAALDSYNKTIFTPEAPRKIPLLNPKVESVASYFDNLQNLVQAKIQTGDLFNKVITAKRGTLNKAGLQSITARDIKNIYTILGKEIPEYLKNMSQVLGDEVFELPMPMVKQIFETIKDSKNPRLASVVQKIIREGEDKLVDIVRAFPDGAAKSFRDFGSSTSLRTKLSISAQRFFAAIAGSGPLGRGITDRIFDEMENATLSIAEKYGREDLVGLSSEDIRNLDANAKKSAILNPFVKSRYPQDRAKRVDSFVTPQNFDSLTDQEIAAHSDEYDKVAKYLRQKAEHDAVKELKQDSIFTESLRTFSAAKNKAVLDSLLLSRYGSKSLLDALDMKVPSAIAMAANLDQAIEQAADSLSRELIKIENYSFGKQVLTPFGESFIINKVQKEITETKEKIAKSMVKQITKPETFLFGIRESEMPKITGRYGSIGAEREVNYARRLLIQQASGVFGSDEAFKRLQRYHGMSVAEIKAAIKQMRLDIRAREQLYRDVITNAGLLSEEEFDKLRILREWNRAQHKKIVDAYNAVRRGEGLPNMTRNEAYAFLSDKDATGKSVHTTIDVSGKEVPLQVQEIGPRYAPRKTKSLDDVSEISKRINTKVADQLTEVAEKVQNSLNDAADGIIDEVKEFDPFGRSFEEIDPEGAYMQYDAEDYQSGMSQAYKNMIDRQTVFQAEQVKQLGSFDEYISRYYSQFRVSMHDMFQSGMMVEPMYHYLDEISKISTEIPSKAIAPAVNKVRAMTQKLYHELARPINALNRPQGRPIEPGQLVTREYTLPSGEKAVDYESFADFDDRMRRIAKEVEIAKAKIIKGVVNDAEFKKEFNKRLKTLSKVDHGSYFSRGTAGELDELQRTLIQEFMPHYDKVLAEQTKEITERHHREAIQRIARMAPRSIGPAATASQVYRGFTMAAKSVNTTMATVMQGVIDNITNIADPSGLKVVIKGANLKEIETVKLSLRKLMTDVTMGKWADLLLINIDETIMSIAEIQQVFVKAIQANIDVISKGKQGLLTGRVNDLFENMTQQARKEVVKVLKDLDSQLLTVGKTNAHTGTDLMKAMRESGGLFSSKFAEYRNRVLTFVAKQMSADALLGMRAWFELTGSTTGREIDPVVVSDQTAYKRQLSLSKQPKSIVPTPEIPVSVQNLSKVGKQLGEATEAAAGALKEVTQDLQEMTDSLQQIPAAPVVSDAPVVPDTPVVPVVSAKSLPGVVDEKVLGFQKAIEEAKEQLIEQQERLSVSINNKRHGMVKRAKEKIKVIEKTIKDTQKELDQYNGEVAKSLQKTNKALAKQALKDSKNAVAEAKRLEKETLREAKRLAKEEALRVKRELKESSKAKPNISDDTVIPGAGQTDSGNNFKNSADDFAENMRNAGEQIKEDMADAAEAMEVEIDTAFAKVFQGPNLFKGPNTFLQNAFIDGDKAKIKFVDNLSRSYGPRKVRVDQQEYEKPNVRQEFSPFTKELANPNPAFKPFALLGIGAEAEKAAAKLKKLKDSLNDSMLRFPFIGEKAFRTMRKVILTAEQMSEKMLILRKNGAVAKFLEQFYVARLSNTGMEFLRKTTIRNLDKINTKLKDLRISKFFSSFNEARKAGTLLEGLGRSIRSLGSGESLRAIAGGMRSVAVSASLLPRTIASTFFNSIHTSKLLPPFLTAVTAGLSTVGLRATRTMQKLGGFSSALYKTASAQAVFDKVKAKGLKAGRDMDEKAVKEDISKLRKLQKLRMGAPATLKAGTVASIKSAGTAIGSVAAVFVKLLMVMTIAAPLFIIMGAIFATFKSMGNASSIAIKDLKEAFRNLLQAIVNLANPIFDMIQSFGGFAGMDVQNQAEKSAGAFATLARIILRVSEAFKRFSETVGKSFVTNTFAPFLLRIINRFILLKRAIGAAFRGDNESAIKTFKAFLWSIAYDLVGVIGLALKGIGKLFEVSAGVVGRFFGWMTDKFIGFVLYVLEGLRSIAMAAAVAFAGIAALLTAFTGVGGAPFGALALGAGGATAAIFVLEKTLTAKRESLVNGATKIGEAFSRKVGGAFITVGQMAKGAQRIIMKEYEQLVGKPLNVPLATIFKDSKSVAKQIKDQVDKASPAALDGGESLASKIAKGVKNGMLDLQVEFTEKLFGNLDNQFEKVTGKIKKQLDLQRENALDAFDDMSAGIDALAEAEEKLTKKMDYEENRREMIRNRANDVENYVRERKLAIYEGRYEDARRLDGEERNAKVKADKELLDLDKGYNRDLQSEQRDIAKAVIENQKKELEKQFDLLEENFDEQIEILKEKGFASKEEFKTALTDLGAIGGKFSETMAEAFGGSMNALPAAISKWVDPAIEMFDTDLNTLVDIAAQKFGATGNVSDPKSILGAAYYMANGVTTAFQSAFNSSIISQYVTPTMDAIKGIITTTTADTAITTMWDDAGVRAVNAMMAGIKRTIAGLHGELFKEFETKFATMIAKLKEMAEIKITLEISREAIKESGGGSGNKKSGYSFEDPSAGYDPFSNNKRPSGLYGTADSMERQLKQKVEVDLVMPSAPKLSTLLWQLAKDINDAAGVAIWEFAKDLLGIEMWTKYFNNLKEWWNKTAVPWLKEAWNGLFEGVKNAWANITNWFTVTMPRSVAGFMVDIGKKLSGAWDGLFTGLKNTWNDITNWFKTNVTDNPVYKAVTGLGSKLKGLFTGPGSYKGGLIPSPGYYNGGLIPLKGYAEGGFTGAVNPNKAVPAILHGGEFVLNHKAVERIGLGALTKMNDNRLPQFKKGGYVGQIPTGSVLRGKSADMMERALLGKTNAPLPKVYPTSAMTFEGESEASKKIILQYSKDVAQGKPAGRSVMDIFSTDKKSIWGGVKELGSVVKWAAADAGNSIFKLGNELVNGLASIQESMSSPFTDKSWNPNTNYWTRQEAQTGKPLNIGAVFGQNWLLQNREGVLPGSKFGFMDAFNVASTVIPVKIPGLGKFASAMISQKMGVGGVVPLKNVISASLGNMGKNVLSKTTGLSSQILAKSGVTRFINDTRQLISRGFESIDAPKPASTMVDNFDDIHQIPATKGNMYRPLFKGLFNLGEKIKIFPKYTAEAYKQVQAVSNTGLGQRGKGLINWLGRSFERVHRLRNEMFFDKDIKTSWRALTDASDKTSQRYMYLERLAAEQGVPLTIGHRFNPVLTDIAGKSGPFGTGLSGSTKGPLSTMYQELSYGVGPFTKMVDFFSNLNPFRQKIGLHVGAPGTTAFTPEGIMNAPPLGPADTLPGYLYMWLKGNPKQIADRSLGFLQGEFKPDNSTIYIVKAVSKILRDGNIFASEARRTTSATILNSLPSDASPEIIASALAKARKDFGIKNNIINFIKKIIRKNKKTTLPNNPLSVKEPDPLSLVQQAGDQTMPSPSGKLSSGTLFDPSIGEVVKSIDTYSINNKKIAFGLHEVDKLNFDTSGIELIDKNPYTIAGVDSSKVSSQFAVNYLAATSQHTKELQEQGAKELVALRSSQVDALLYAASQGNKVAQTEYDRLVRLGLEGRASSRTAAGNEFFEKAQANTTSAFRTFKNLKLEDLLLVHETQYPLEGADPSNLAKDLVLNPASHFKTKFFAEDGTLDNEYIRDSIHFSLNHLVSGHQQRQGYSNPHIIVARLMDVLEANPGALDNLWSVDTYLTPQARRGLTIPGNSYKYLTPEWTTNKESATSNAIRELIGKSRMDEMFEEGISPFVKGGDHGSGTDGFDSWLAYHATKMGVGFGPGHFDSPLAHLAQMGKINGPDEPWGFRGGKKGIEYLEHYLAELNDNSIARILDRSDWLTNVLSTPKFKLDKFMKGGFVPGAPSIPVPSILHGGEYVINSNAVKNLGLSTLASINQSKFKIPSRSLEYAGGGQASSVSTVNINVDTFIGEEEWFGSMMKQYNIKVLPRKQKAAGLEKRNISTYTGLNGGK